VRLVFRDIEGRLSCVMGVAPMHGTVYSNARPKELHSFREIQGPGIMPIATPGDILFPIRSTRMDLLLRTGDTDHVAAQQRSLHGGECTASTTFSMIATDRLRRWVRRIRWNRPLSEATIIGEEDATLPEGAT